MIARVPRPGFMLTHVSGTEQPRIFNGTIKNFELQPGVYELEEIISPTGTGIRWLVLKGTRTGCPVTGWYSFGRKYNITIEGRNNILPFKPRKA